MTSVPQRGMRHRWRFTMDVGGTFTDVLATSSDGETRVVKLLSSARVRGVVGPGSGCDRIVDIARRGEPRDFWRGYRLAVGSDAGSGDVASVRNFDPSSGTIWLDRLLPTEPVADSAYELRSPEEAPVLAIRMVLGLPLDAPIGAVDVRLGTTRATNALLERRGARVALVTTSGLGDFLRIGHQNRPELFELNIRERDELAATVIEVDERLAADGRVLVPLDLAGAGGLLRRCRAEQIDSLAICLLHAHVNPGHEEALLALANQIGFAYVAISSRVSRREGFVSRGDTTVVDAYVGPIIRAYVDALRKSMPEASIKLMCSHGGLMDAASVSGKDTILSGPAGGVVGSARLGAKGDAARLVGFDMGGTSTDVCRIDGPFEYQHETVKAGVRLMTPMLAVETVAAGGGSVCGFDGENLFVGPRSAGADPGPACYGRGGPLTITDMNLLLGRFHAAGVPFPVDRHCAESELRALTDRVNAAGGKRLEPLELAAGFIRIANERMAGAIRQISTSRGYDVREYSLVSFGGAGGQHACAVARLLGMRSVIHSPWAGVLSAVGIGLAPVRRVRERSVALGSDRDGIGKACALADELAAQATQTLTTEESVDAASVTVEAPIVEVCYAGQATTIPVPLHPTDDFVARCEEAHRRLYGYHHAGRPIEIRAVRAEVVSGETTGGLPEWSERREPAPKCDACPAGDGTAAYAVYRREHLAAGDCIRGPALLVEQTSTLVIDSGWTARVETDGRLVVSDEAVPVRDAAGGTECDPIEVELFRNRFAAVAERMGATLRRTAMSTNVKDRLDFSCAVFSGTGDLIVNAPHIPVHLGGMSHCVRALIEDVPQFAPGDVYVTNDPFRGGSHLNDVTVVTPVFERDDRPPVFFVASRAHHAEIGGTRPGSMPADSRSLADEGVLIRNFRWIAAGQARDAELELLLTSGRYPSRAPKENLADLAAQSAANLLGAGDLGTMLATFGRDALLRQIDWICDSAERQARRVIERIPRGDHKFTDRLDDGTAIRLTIRTRGDSAELDFTGTSPVVPGNFNANVAIVSSAVMYCLCCLTPDRLPLNAGLLRPIRIVLPECFLNPPAGRDAERCPAVAAGNVETSQRIVDCVLGALGAAAASQGTMNNLLMGDKSFGYYETICGGAGAGPGFHGASAVHTHMTNTRLTDTEVLESRYPVRVVEFQIRRGSGGAGAFQGGDGVRRVLEFLAPLEVSMISQRRDIAPYGLAGGMPGMAGHNAILRRGAAREKAMSGVFTTRVEVGDQLVIETPGGGGYSEAR